MDLQTKETTIAKPLPRRIVMSIDEADLAPLRARISKLEGQLKYLYEKLNIEFGPEILPPDDPKIVELLKKGKVMDAIIMYRQSSNAGLAEEKEAVEEIQKRLGL
jgi:hypothetical protein